MKRKISVISAIIALLLCFTAVFSACGEDVPDTDVESGDGVNDGQSESESASESESERESESESESKTEDGKYSERTVKIPENLDKIKVYGRHTKNNVQVTLGWSASGIEFKADCKGDVTVKFISSAAADFAVYIDGVEQPVLSVSTMKWNYTLNSQPLPEGVHTFRIVKRSNVEKGVSRFEWIKLNGNLLECDKMDNKLIEFVGDSITCGSGLFVGRENDFDATLAYSYLLANDLGYDWSMVSVSGIGIHASNSRHGTNINQEYLKTNYLASSTVLYTPAKKADIVVVNLNTNDHNNGATEAEYKATVREFIGKVRSVHGENVPIVWVRGMMIDANKPVNNWLADVFAEKGGESAGLYIVTVTKNNDAPYSHPDAEANDIVAGEIKAFLEAKGLV